MGDERDWHPERYRPLLHLQVHLMKLDPQFRRRFDSSDLVQEALLKAHAHRDRCRGTTEAERVGWLREILKTVAVDKVREATAGKRETCGWSSRSRPPWPTPPAWSSSWRPGPIA